MPGPIAAPAAPAPAAIPLIAGNLPGLPSPANGVPATPDFLSGLAQAAPAAIQGFEMGQKMREQRRQRGMQALQQLAPYAISNPKDPNVSKAVQRAFSDAGLNPKAALNADGSLNTSALVQYNPYFKELLTAVGNPNANPAAIKFLAQQAGIPADKLPNLGLYTPKELDEQVKTFSTALTNYQKGQGDHDTLVRMAESLQEPLMQAGRTLEARSIIDEANSAQLGAGAQSLIARRALLNDQTIQNVKKIGAQVDLIHAQTGNYTALTALNKQTVVLRQVQTAEGAANVQRIQADTGRILAQTSKVYADIQATQSRLAIAVGNLSARNLSSAIVAAKDHNSQYASLKARVAQEASILERYNSTSTTTGTDTQGNQVVNPDYAALKKQYETDTAALQKLRGPINLDKLTQAALQRAGLPNTVTIDSFETPQSNKQTPPQVAAKPPVIGAIHGNKNGVSGWKYPDGSFHPDK